MKQRQGIILKGDRQWCRDSVFTLLTAFDPSRCICLSNQPLEGANTIALKKAQTVLGQEFSAVIVDGSDGLNPDSLGAMVGTIVAGGALIIMLNDAESDSLWLQRFMRICEQYQQATEFIQVIQQGQSVSPPLLPELRSGIDFTVNQDQQQAIDAILKVVSGHRRRPLVLSADRGRGKSAALGLAAAELIKQGKQSILVTAPSFASAETVFEHAKRLLPDASYSQGQLLLDKATIRFIAPDRLVEEDFKADLVLVDEAAAIPASILELLLDKFSRIVFSSTIHGYEGTGRGFAVRFQQTLNAKTPNWNNYHIKQPVRWRDDDILEQFSFDALLLNASAEQAEMIADATASLCQFEKVDQHRLFNDETRLHSLFGLMVQAHYRTRPSDLMMLLDSDDVSLYVMQYQGHVVASSLCVEEGELSTELADAVYSGERRLKGHLVPQSLLAHAGLVKAGDFSYRRIIRVAVHPELQGRGIGQQMVEQIAVEARKDHKDFMGVSFASSTEIIHFWSRCAYIPLRLGMHHDEVSGSHAMLMLNPLDKAAQTLASDGLDKFTQQWPSLLHQVFQRLKPELVITISQLLNRDNESLSECEQHEVKAFAYRQRSYDVCQFTLKKAMSIWVSQTQFLTLTPQQQALCILLVLQQQAVSVVAKDLSYRGKSEVIAEMRKAVGLLCA